MIDMVMLICEFSSSTQKSSMKVVDWARAGPRMTLLLVSFSVPVAGILMQASSIGPKLVCDAQHVSLPHADTCAWKRLYIGLTHDRAIVSE